MNVLDLFSGIGGFSLGLERAGMRTVAFCEIDPFCRKVLAKNFPGVPCYPDIRELTAEQLRADGIAVDLICGGFPCQDISLAGKGAGIEGERSGLWSEYARIIGELRPRYVIVENVAALLNRGLDKVLADLAALGFDAEWHCIPASAVGAPHRRDRLWIVADSEYGREPDRSWEAGWQTGEWSAERGKSRCNGEDVALAKRYGSQGSLWAELCGIQGGQHQPPGRSGHWLIEPDVGRVAHGVPARVDRLRSLGNAVVPQIPEIIGRAIMAAEIEQ